MRNKHTITIIAMVAALGLLAATSWAISQKPVSKVVMETTVLDYTVSTGDTLWDIATNYYGDPWLWPLIWELNPKIKNPQWIFPDQKIKIKLEQGREYVFEAKSMEALFYAPEDWWDPTFYYNTKSNALDFISKATFEQAGEIVDQYDDEEILGTHDKVRFTMSENANVQIGDIFTIFRTKRKVKHPTKGDYLGYIVDVLGEIDTSKATTLETGRIVYEGDIKNASAEISMGDRIIFMPRDEYTVTLNKTSLDLKGAVIGFEDGRTYFGQHDNVYIDLGLKDGLEVGNSFSIWRESKNKKKLPGYFVGNLIVLHVEPNVSTALVTNSLYDLHIGDSIQSDIE